MTPVLVPQFDGGPLASLDCFAAEGAMLVALETNGARRPTATEFRSHVYNLDAGGHPTTRDLTGGGRPLQIVETAKRAYGVTVDLQVMAFDAAWELGQRTDTMLGLSISYGPVSVTKFDGSPGFTGFHGICFSGGLVYDPLADGRRAGIPKGPQAWPRDLLMRACALYADTGAGRAVAIVAKAPATKPRRYSVAFESGAVWLYDRAGGRTRHTFARKTSAPCTAPFTIPWPGGRKRVVEITAGFLLGKRVEPGAAHVELVGA